MTAMPNPPDAATDQASDEWCVGLRRQIAGCRCAPCTVATQLLNRIDADRATALATAQRLVECEAELVALRASYAQQGEHVALQAAKIDAFRADLEVQRQAITSYQAIIATLRQQLDDQPKAYAALIEAHAAQEAIITTLRHQLAAATAEATATKQST